MPQDFPVTAADANARLDLFLAQRLSVGRAQVKKLLAAGAVKLNGKAIGEKQKGILLHVGSVLAVEGFTPRQEQLVTPRADLPLVVLSQGDGWVIIDKPAGQAVHPLSPEQTDTALNAVAARFPEIQGVGESGLRSGVVHRLDTDTSGTLLFATKQGRFEELRRAFQEHATKKVYRAIVAGQLEGAQHVRRLLHISRHSPATVSVVDPTTGEAQYPAGTRECTLAYRVIEQLDDATLVEIDLHTGFLHQIRVMMADLGHPVLGDKAYAEEPVRKRAPRQMLHASFLRAGVASGTAGDPGDFAGVLKRLRPGGRGRAV